MERFKLMKETKKYRQHSLQGVLNYLAFCRERNLVLVMLVARLVLLGLMLFARRGLPLVFSRFDTLVFDTCELFYDDYRLSELRHWDGVHFFHIAAHGYSHENLCVFFPGIPALIRVVTYVVKDCFPLLHRLAPVTFYMCALNIAATCLAGVLLRRLTVLTLLGPWALAHMEDRHSHLCQPKATNSMPCAAESIRFPSTDDRVTGETMMDELAVCTKFNTPVDGARSCNSKQGEHLRWQTVGGATLMWVLTPTSVFTLVVYTESLFALLSFLGVYLLAYHPPVALEAPSRPVTVQWKAAYTSWRELAAVMSFLFAATLRSNGFLLAGFLLYPMFLQLFFPATYRRRCAMQYARISKKRHVIDNGSAKECDTLPSAVPKTSSSCEEVVAMRALYPPTRYPNVARVVVLLMESALLFAPYFMMNYLGWSRFASRWSGNEQEQIGRCFWRFYGLIQKKYWNVGLFTSYTMQNLPNVLIAMPMAIVFGLTAYRYYYGPAIKQWWEGAQPGTEAISTSSPPCTVTVHKRYLGDMGAMRRYHYRLVYLLHRGHELLESVVQSSNTVYLTVLFCVSLAIMHVQVTNRFVMSSPALYWLAGEQIARYPRSRTSRMILLCSIQWNILGAVLFSNHMPWT